MSNISISLKHEKRILGAFRASPGDLAKAIQKALEQTGGETVGKVKQVIASGTGMWKAPVDTGTMMRNISIVEKTPVKVVISPNMTITPYAYHVHESGKRPRPFLDITAKTEAKNIQSFFQRTLERFASDLARKIG